MISRPPKIAVDETKKPAQNTEPAPAPVPAPTEPEIPSVTLLLLQCRNLLSFISGRLEEVEATERLRTENNLLRAELTARPSAGF